MKGRRFVYLAAALFAVAGVLLLAGPAGASRQVHATAATNVHCGDTINTSITLNGDLDCSAYNGTALTIVTDGVTLDLGGFTITGNSSQTVVYSDTVNNWTVQNGTISGGDDQVENDYSDGVTIQNLTLTGAADSCFYTYYSAGTVIANNSCTGTDSYGLYSDSSAGTYASGNVFTNDGDAVYLDEYDNGDTFVSNYFRTNSDDAVDDNYSDLNVYYGNIASGNLDDGFDIYADEYGSVTMTNNASRVNGEYGFTTYYAYSDLDGIVPPYSMFSGNTANYNASYGFYDQDSYGSTWTNNYAARNNDHGFYFDYPGRETITNNTAKMNNGDGFYLSETYTPYDALSFANNSAWYNTGYGFEAPDYAQAGTGNVGGGTNGTADCYMVSGCS